MKMRLAFGVLCAATVLAAPETPLQKATKQELVACEDFDSREMAHAATREIARVERARASDTLKNFRTAEAELKKTTEAGKPEAELAALRAALAERLTTMHASEDRLIADSATASKASVEMFAEQEKLRATMAAARKAEEDSLKKARGKDVDAARLALHEVEALQIIETQTWPVLLKKWAGEFVEQARDSAKVARELIPAEPDAARRERLEKFASEQTAHVSTAEKIIAKCDAELATPQSIYPARMAAMGGLPLLDPQQWDYAKARHLLVRAGFGGTPQEVAKLHAMGFYRAVEFVVEFYRQPAPADSFDPMPPVAMDPLENRLTVRTMSTRVAQARTSVERGQVAQLRQAWLRRLVESPRPLQEKLAVFWHGLFASQDSVVQNSYTMARQIQLFREHAAGNYGALLFGIVHDPAMIRYLDNNKNVRGEPNENLAREIMELFSLGLDQGYTEKDIAEAARALTGYNYDDTTGAFRFHHAQHDTTDKTVFGKTGPWTGDDLVRLILEKPETARFVARRLFEYFAHGDPSTEVIERLAGVLRARNYDLDPMLKNLFLSQEFYSPRAMGHQIKSPVELVAGLLRDTGVKQVANYATIDAALQKMGMTLLEPPDVKGWRYGRTWINSQRVFVRYNAVADLIRTVSQDGGARGVDLVGFVLAADCEDAAEALDYLAKACLVRPLNETKRQELLTHLGELPPCGDWAKQRAAVNDKLRSILVLMLSTPEFQMT